MGYQAMLRDVRSEFVSEGVVFGPKESVSSFSVIARGVEHVRSEALVDVSQAQDEIGQSIADLLCKLYGEDNSVTAALGGLFALVGYQAMSSGEKVCYQTLILKTLGRTGNACQVNYMNFMQDLYTFLVQCF